jgi:hypothetical protein
VAELDIKPEHVDVEQLPDILLAVIGCSTAGSAVSELPAAAVQVVA